MPVQDNIAADPGFVINPPEQTESKPNPVSSGNAPEDAGFRVSPPQQLPTQDASSEPSANKYGEESGFKIANMEQTSPESELRRSESPQRLQVKDRPPENPDAPWYEKLWDFANAPLIDDKTIKNWFGADVEHWTGWSRGLLDLAEGLTSPLSIGLAVGTFGSSSLIESGGAAALKAAGMTADEIGEVVNGSKIMAKSLRMGMTPEDALAVARSYGTNGATLQRGLMELSKVGLKPESMIAKGIVRRTGSAMLRSYMDDPGKAETIATGVQGLVDAGFTLQNAYGAVVMAPKVLDALKDGNYEAAQRYAVDAAGMGLFATLGGKAVHEHAGELMTDAEAQMGLRVKPSEENLKLMRILEPMEKNRILAGENHKVWEEQTRKDFKDVLSSSESELRARFWRESDGNLDDWNKQIKDSIQSGELKNKSAEYQNRLLAATDSSKLTDREVEYAKHAGAHFDETATEAVAKGVLPAAAEDYVTRAWKDPENDTVRKFKTISRSGDFSVNTSMARKRIFESTLEGLLKGYELKDHDMVALAAFNGNTFSNIAAARDALQRIRGAGARASDGRPMGAISGAGHVIEGTDEEGNPINVGTVIRPDAMQSLRIADKVIQGLKEDVLKERTARVGGPERRAAVRPTDQEYQDYIERLRIPEARKALVDATTDEEKLTAQQTLDNLVEMAKQKSSEYKAYKPRQEFTQLDRLIKEGKIVQLGINKRTGEPYYGWTTHDYVTVDHPAFRDWKVPTGDTDGNPVYVNGELKVHPEAAEYLKRRFETQESLTKKIPGLKTALAAGREAKGWLLAFSPFHFMQEGLRAIMTGISPIGVERFNPENPMHVLAAEKGVWEFKNYNGIRSFEDGLVGHSKIMSKIPVLREIQSWTQSMLFDRYIPGLKLRAFERVMAANENLHPEWTKNKLAEESAMEVNERFGGIPYKRIGRSAAAMDLARLTTLAPDWLESEMRFMKRVFGGDEGKLARRDVAKMALGLWATARVLNYLTTGKLHNEAPFGVAYKDQDGKEKIYSVRTLPGDVLHAVSDPIGFMNGRTAPLLKSALMTYTGRDEQGRKLSSNGIFVNLMRNVTPISLEKPIQTATGVDTGVSGGDQAAKALGFTVTPYRTEAQRLASKLASEKNEAGPLDPAKLRRFQTVSRMEDDLRAGQINPSVVQDAVEKGILHIDEAKRIMDNLKKTTGMDGDTARLYSQASRLPLEDVIKIWNAATSEEKAAIAKLIISKKNSYVRKVFKDTTPEERQNDPTYQWIKRNFPAEQTF